MITSSTWLNTLTRSLVSGTCPLLTLHTTECFAASTPTFGVAPGVGGQEMKLNPEKWLAERAARSWTAGIGKRNDLQGKLRSTPRRHCIGTRLDFFFILCPSSIKQLEVMIMMVMIMRIFACSDKDTNPQYLYTHCRAASVLFYPKRKTSSRNLSTRISTNLANLLNSVCKRWFGST